MSEMEVHPVADLFPMLGEDDLAELAADIRERGLLHPIVLDPQGRLLDGRNRLAACGLAGVDPSFTTYEGDDPDGYALAVNIARRHMTKGQVAMVAAKAQLFPGNNQHAIAAAAQVSQSRIAKAVTVRDHAPDLVDAVVSGATSLNDAYAEAKRRKVEAETREEATARQVRKLDRLRHVAPDLADLVEEERMSLDEAWKLHSERVERERESARKATTELAHSVAYLSAAVTPEWREYIRNWWDLGLCEASPTETKHITPESLRAIGDGLRALGEEMESARNE